MFASSVHVSGLYPWGRVAAPSDPIRPDTLHALSKVTERVWEACTPTATASRSQSSDRRLRHGTHRTSVPVWLAQPRRPSALVTAALAPYRPRHLVLRAARNTRRFYTEDGWADLGYHPQDDAEQFAHRWPDAIPLTLQGMTFTDPLYTGD